MFTRPRLKMFSIAIPKPVCFQLNRVAKEIVDSTFQFDKTG